MNAREWFYVLAVPCAQLLLGATLSVLSCGSPQDPAPNIVKQPGSELCGEACDVMRTRLRPDDAGPDVVGCEEAQDILLQDGGKMTCEGFCLYQHNNGIFWNTECIVNTITTCEQIETVCNR